MAKVLKPLTVLVIQRTSKDGHTFMTAKAKAELVYNAGARITKTSLDENVNFDVKLTKATGLTLPAKEGVYEVDFAEAFEDTREGLKRPTLWIKPKDAAQRIDFVFKKDLPNPDAPRKEHVETICILDEE